MSAKRIEKLEQELAEARKKLDTALHAKRAPQPSPRGLPKRPKRSKKVKSLSAILCLSDWHIEEKTREYGPDGKLIASHGVRQAKKKAEQILDSAIRVAHHRSQDGYLLDHTTIYLGGDFITGHLHPDNVEQCELPPAEAAIVAQELLANFIVNYVSETTARTIRIVTRAGNHGRTTPRMRVATWEGHSWEQIIYLGLQKQLQNLRTRAGRKIEWVIGRGVLTYTREPLGLVRWVHGHEIRFSGGVNGLAVPVAKKVRRWNSSPGEAADLTVLGHFHQLEYLSGPPSILVNGSLIGVSSYGRSLGFGSQTPMQAHLVFSDHHKKHFGIDYLHADSVPDCS